LTTIVNLGCGDRPIPGVVNVDHVYSKGVNEVAEIESLPFRTRSVDVVLASHVLEHVQSIPKAMLEINRILKPGGRLIAWLPVGFTAIENPFHTHVWTPRTVRYLCPDTETTDNDRLRTGFRFIELAITLRRGFLVYHIRKWLNVRSIGIKYEMRFTLEAI